MKCFHLSCPKVFTVSNFFLGILQKWFFTSIHSFGLSPLLTQLYTETGLKGAGGSGSGHLKNHKLCRHGPQRSIYEPQHSLYGTSQVVLVVKNPPANAEDTRDAGSLLGSERSPGGANGTPLQYSCLEDFMDRGAWWTIVQGAVKSRTQLSTHPHTHTTHTESSLYMTKEKSELGCRLLTVRYFVMMCELLFISEKLQSVITTEINGCLSLFSARNLFLAKFKFLLLEHHDQLKDHEGMKTVRRFIQQA